MKIVDANVLLYATNEDDDRWRTSLDWLDAALNRSETVGFAWIVLLGFLRLSTHPTIRPRPLDVDTATEVVELWCRQPPAVVLEPGAGHLTRVRELLAPTGTGGNLVNDAHLAALALQHKATVVTYDNDFGRFPGVTWRTPEDLLDV